MTLPWTVLNQIWGRFQSPLAVVLGAPRLVARFAETTPDTELTCYQMDLHQAESLREELREKDRPAEVVAHADLWDLPADFRTVLYPAPRGGERSLKIDMIEQAFHIMKPGGKLYVLSPFPSDSLFPSLLKKVFGRRHVQATDAGSIIWAQREGERRRRRHEVTYTVRENEINLPIVSRPGVFSYGRLDPGARALLAVMEIQPGDRVLDLGCGCGTNGIVAGRRSGPEGSTMFVDSNLRAVAMVEHNAQSLGLAQWQALATSNTNGLPPESFDVVVANPPYYAQHEIARRFIESSHRALCPGGRLYLVTKQPDAILEIIMTRFRKIESALRSGYTVYCCRR